MSARNSPSLRYAIYDGIAWALMAGFGEAFLSAYAIFLSATPTHLALLGAFPAFIPAISQSVGVKLLSFIPSRRKLTSLTAALQGLSWLPLASLGLILGTSPESPIYLLAFAAIYFFFAGLGAPAWNSLIGDLVPNHSRGAYFGLRNRRMGYATLIALLLAGPLLTTFHGVDERALGFAVLFFIAFICRSVSAYWLSRYEDPVAEKSADSYFSFLDFLKRTPYSNFTKFVWFVSLINFGLAICGPFFSLYILKELRFSYAEFTILSASMIASQIITLQHWGGLSDRFGNKAILFVAAPLITLAPLLWIISDSFWWLLFVHLYSGFIWAGFNLSASNFLFDAVSPAKRARCAAYQSILNGTFMLVGSLLGSYLLNNPLESLHSVFKTSDPKLDYHLIFAGSCIIRIIVVCYFWKLIKEVREVELIAHKDLVFKVIQVKALAGLVFGFDTKHDENKAKLGQKDKPS